MALICLLKISIFTNSKFSNFSDLLHAMILLIAIQQDFCVEFYFICKKRSIHLNYSNNLNKW